MGSFGIFLGGIFLTGLGSVSGAQKSGAPQLLSGQEKDIWEVGLGFTLVKKRLLGCRVLDILAVIKF